MKRDNYTCQYCGTSQGRMTLDHVIPRTLGGKDEWDNLVCACESCNSRKSDRSPHEVGMKLLRRPKRPHYFSFVIQSFGIPPQEWRPYLFMS
jgi:5-methylcytosine-specific restriction endonuclease McrA